MRPNKVGNLLIVSVMLLQVALATPHCPTNYLIVLVPTSRNAKRLPNLRN